MGIVIFFVVLIGSVLITEPINNAIQESHKIHRSPIVQSLEKDGGS